jgi:hypothetical protein
MLTILIKSSIYFFIIVFPKSFYNVFYFYKSEEENKPYSPKDHVIFNVNN